MMETLIERILEPAKDPFAAYLIIVSGPVLVGFIIFVLLNVFAEEGISEEYAERFFVVAGMVIAAPIFFLGMLFNPSADPEEGRYMMLCLGITILEAVATTWLYLAATA